jgi:hypothetical protein
MYNEFFKENQFKRKSTRYIDFNLKIVKLRSIYLVDFLLNWFSLKNSLYIVVYICIYKIIENCITVLGLSYGWSNIVFGVERYFQLYRGQRLYLVLNATFSYIVVAETTDLTQSHWQTYFKDEVSRRGSYSVL